MSLEEERSRGINAQRIIEDDLFQESFESVRAAILHAWASTSMKETENREFLFLMLRAADQFKQGLVTMLETGRMAEIQLDDEKSLDD